jgi:outer membrane protein OmpA-like peptidoglycan-associated protein
MSPSAPFPIVTTPRGVRHALVPATNVESWSADRAYDALMTAMRNDDFAARQLTALARDRGCFDHTPEAVARWLAQEVGRGLLIPVAHREPSPARGRPILGHEGFFPDDWSELTPLSALQEREPTVEFGWLGIELVDHDGVPFAGYELTLVHCDGRRDRVVLDELGRHRARAVALPGPTLVGFPKHVEAPASSFGKLAVDAFAPLPDDVPVPREPRGGLFLKQLDRSYRLVLEAPVKQPPSVSVTPAAPVEASGSWRVRFVLDDGAALAGETVRATPPGNSEVAVELDTSGTMSFDDVGPGVGRVRVSPLRAPRVSGVGEGFVASPHSARFPFGSSAEFDIPAPASRTVVLLRPSVDRTETDTLRFARESSVLVPLDATRSHLEAIATAIALCSERPASALLVVGHTSIDGDPDSNTALALRRALCVRHLIEGARDEWVALVSDHGTPADIQRLLAYLAETHGWPTDPGRTDGVIDDAYPNAVARFQAHYNAIYDAVLEVDGVCGEVTIGALFDAQTYELNEHLATLGASTAAMRSFEPASLGAGASVLAHPALSETVHAEGQRRVDLLLLDDTVEWREAHGIEILYDAARFRTLPTRPLAVGRGDLVLRLIDHYGRALARVAYELVTDADRRTGRSDDDGLVVERGLAGELLQLHCGAARAMPVDLAYQAVGDARFSRPAATDEPAEEDEVSDLGDDDEAGDPDVDDDGDDLNLDLDVEEDEGCVAEDDPRHGPASGGPDGEEE